MDNHKFIGHAQRIVAGHAEWTHKEEVEAEDVLVVWVSKALQNNKGLFTTNRQDGRYHEITYNGDKNEFYHDVYLKEENIVIPTAEVWAEE